MAYNGQTEISTEIQSLDRKARDSNLIKNLNVLSRFQGFFFIMLPWARVLLGWISVYLKVFLDMGSEKYTKILEKSKYVYRYFEYIELMLRGFIEQILFSYGKGFISILEAFNNIKI